MYMWLVLSTFLAILAGYSVPMRADAPEKMNVPVASAHVMKMVINHRSALNYVKNKRYPYYCEGAAEGEIIANCAPEKRTGYNIGSLTNDNINPYIPDGFTISEDYNSHILCLKDDGTLGTYCDQDDTPTRYLVTYGDLHEKWLSSISLVAGEGADKPKVSPDEDLVKALRDNFGYNELIGYVLEDSDSGEKYIINYQGIKIFTIPSEMWTIMDNSNMCNEKYNGSCLAFVSPI